MNSLKPSNKFALASSASRWTGNNCVASAGTSVSLGTLISPESPGSRITTRFTTASSAGGRDGSTFSAKSISSTSRAIAVETPQLGHATYLFSKPQSIEAFLAAYTATTKEAIRQNRANVAERLGFLGRVVHGSNPRIWLRTLTARLGEAADYASGRIRGRVNMQNETNTKAEIIALLEGRTQVSLENIRQFILDLDERDYMEFLYPSDPDFVEELEGRNAEAKGMLETLRDIEGTLRGLDRGEIKIQ